MRSEFDSSKRSASARNARSSGGAQVPREPLREPRPGEHTGERRLRLLRLVLGENLVPKRRPSGAARKSGGS
jgi:hypothetical protein